MSAMARRAGEVYASEHELFDIGLASVELHATGRRSPVPPASMCGGPGDMGSTHIADGGPRAVADRAILLRLSLFLHAGEIGVALALAGLFELSSATHLLQAALLSISGCSLAWYAWRGARDICGGERAPTGAR